MKITIGTILRLKTGIFTGIVVSRGPNCTYVLVTEKGEVTEMPETLDWEIIAEAPSKYALCVYERYKQFLKANKVLWNREIEDQHQSVTVKTHLKNNGDAKY